VTRYVKGHPRLEWIKAPGRRNEALDCAVYALAGAHRMNMDRWKDGDWNKWAGRVENRDLFDAPVEVAEDKPQEPATPVESKSATPRRKRRHVGRIN